MREVWMTAAGFAALRLPGLPPNKRGVLRRAKAEGWVSRKRRGRGGGREYPLSALPPAARAAFVERQTPEVPSSPAATAAQEAGMAAFAALSGEARTRAEARLTALLAFRDFLGKSDRAPSAAAEEFARAWRRGELEVEDKIRVDLPEFTGRSLLNWRRRVANEGIACLGGHYGIQRRRSGKIERDPEVRDFILAMLTEYQEVSVKLIGRAMAARFPEKSRPSYRDLHRWIARWRKANPVLSLQLKSPEGWRGAYQSALGDAAEAILALNQRWEIDSTKADLMLADGGRHTIVGAIDVWSRRLKLLVSRSSSSAALCALLRRALLDWGVPRSIATDHGPDYVSARFRAVLAGLEIEHAIAPPFTPERKPFIERAFGSFNHDLIELLPGYSGHSVAERKRIESRNRFAQRLMDAKARIDLRLTAEQLQDFCDRWCDHLYQHAPHSGLGGQTPFTKAAAWTGGVRNIQDPRALDLLLSEPARRRGLRVTKKGLILGRRSYGSAALGPYIGREVRALWDESDIARLYVFDADGAFIAEAICPELSDCGISRQELARATKAAQKQALDAARRALKTTARRVNVAGIVEEILALKSGEAARLLPLPQSAAPHVTPALIAAGRGVEKDAPILLAPIRAERRARIEAELTAPLPAVPLPAVPLPAAPLPAAGEAARLETGEQRYARARALEKAEAEGRPLAPAEVAWLTRYRRQPEYRARRMVERDFEETG